MTYSTESDLREEQQGNFQDLELCAPVYIRFTATSAFEANVVKRFPFDQVKRGCEGSLLGFLCVEYWPAVVGAVV